MGAFHQKSIWWDAPLFLFLALARSTQHREAGRRSADANLMFEGIGSNSQQADLRICRTNALLANLF